MDIFQILSESVDKEVLTEELKTKIADVFALAVEAKIAEEKKTITESVTKELDEKYNQELVEFKNNLIQTNEVYLEKAVGEFFEENKKAIAESKYVEHADFFFSQMKTIFENQCVSIPEEKENVLHALTKENQTFKNEITEKVTEEAKLKNKLYEYQQVLVFMDKTKGMALTESDEAKELMDGMVFENLEDFKRKLDFVIEKIVKKTPEINPKPTKPVVEGNQNGAKPSEPKSVDKWADQISKF